MDEVVKRKPGRPRKIINEPVTLEQAADDLMSVAREFEVSGEWKKAEGVSLLTIAPEDIEPLGGWVAEEPALTLPQIIALDRDHDGNPGGSWPFASLTENETRGLVAEFFEAYESQVETKRVDTFNRVWSFRHEAVHSQDTMVLSVKRGPVVAERHVPASMARFKDIGAVLAELDQETAR